MTLTVKKHGVILRPTKLSFESKGVFNPSCVQDGRHVHMYYRAWNKQNRSTIGYCKLDGPLKVVERWKKPMLFPEHKYEKNLEDPRITYLDGKYYMAYVAYDGKDAQIAYATSTNLIDWKKHGLIFPKISYDKAEDLFRSCRKRIKERYFLFESYFKEQAYRGVKLWEKDAFFFPKKINGKYALMHRILPDMQIIYFNNFKQLTRAYFERYLKRLADFVVLESKYWYESRNIGGGCPPIETDKGWLLIYHAVDDMDQGRIYRAGAALLDKKNPTKVIGHLREPLFSPEKSWERKGNVPNVVFPTGHAVFGNRLYMYYGAADTSIAVASVNLKSLLKKLLKDHQPKDQIRR